MTRTLKHEFVEYIPAKLADGTIYVSITFATAAHKYCCGCGNEVVTPISPTDWQLTFDGETISLHPSVGNWNLACRSHYFIRRNTLQWAPEWSREEIEAGRRQDRRAKQHHYSTTGSVPTSESAAKERKPDRSFWRKLKNGFR